MTTTEIERHRGALATDPHYTATLPERCREFAQSNMCPEVWRVKRGEPTDVAERKIADLTTVGYSLAELNVRFSPQSISQVYVVHGRPGFMAQLQITLAARWDCQIVPLDDESDADHAVVKALGKDGEWHRVTVTMEEAKAAGWPSKNPNYKSMPDRMLMARACTKAIDRHCPEAKLMLPPADQEEIVFDAEPREIPPAGAETGEMIPIPAAKKMVLDAILAQPRTDDAAPLTDTQAKAVAGLLWSSHRLPNGQDLILRSRIDGILSEFETDQPESDGAEQPADGDQPTPGSDDDVIDGEVVDEHDDNQPTQEDWEAPF